MRKAISHTTFRTSLRRYLQMHVLALAAIRLHFSYHQAIGYALNQVDAPVIVESQQGLVPRAPSSAAPRLVTLLASLRRRYVLQQQPAVRVSFFFL